ncbi:efflux RND transporter periplasmic adaptor subunit [Phaeodactylibacter xiamenensis]|uniref:efflux RND transporter periplasmic adaptor subunit n=1 Tax=Phaeodactylibacter xiamenensis TaxID=1524460 RepID=UPI003BAA44B1
MNDTVNPDNPLFMQFVDLTSGMPNQWLWGFGDGMTSHQQNPVHTLQGRLLTEEQVKGEPDLSVQVPSSAYVKKGAPIASIYSKDLIAKLWAVLEVYETQLSSIRLGRQVHLTTEAFPGERFGGTISFISPVVDPDTRTIEVRVELPNPGHRLKPEMLMEGTVALGAGPGHSPVLLPRSAILWTGKRSVVYVRDSAFNQPVFRPRTVVLGPSLGDVYTIEEGLAPGEEIAVNGVFAIDAAAQLRGGRSMMSPGSVAEEPVAAQHGPGSVLVFSGSAGNNCLSPHNRLTFRPEI